VCSCAIILQITFFRLKSNDTVGYAVVSLLYLDQLLSLHSVALYDAACVPLSLLETLDSDADKGAGSAKTQMEPLKQPFRNL